MVKDKNKNYCLYNISLVSGDTEINVVINAIAVVSYISVITNRGTKDQIASISRTIEKEKEFQKNIYFCFYYSLWLCGSQQAVENSSRDGNTRILSCLLKNLYAGQEATVRTGNGTMDWFQIRKGVHQGCILSPCLFNLYTEYIMRNAWLDEAQAGIKIAERNISNFRNADDTTLMAERKRN